MTKKQLCNMCENYSSEIKCDIEHDCELQKILAENKKLKEENRRLKKELADLRAERSWEKFPDMMGK